MAPNEWYFKYHIWGNSNAHYIDSISDNVIGREKIDNKKSVEGKEKGLIQNWINGCVNSVPEWLILRKPFEKPYERTWKNTQKKGKSLIFE